MNNTMQLPLMTSNCWVVVLFSMEYQERHPEKFRVNRYTKMYYNKESLEHRNIVFANTLEVIENIITDHYEWFTSEYADPEEFRRWRNSIGALLLLHKSINASLNDSRYDYKLAKYCSNEGNIYTESLGQLAYQNNPKFKKFIADNGLAFRAYNQFGKAEITERVTLLVPLAQLVWNGDMFK